MITKKEIREYIQEGCEKMTFCEIVDALADEIYQHETTKKELKTTTEKLEASRRIVKKLRENIKGTKNGKDI